MPNYEWVAEDAANERIGFVFQYLWPEVLSDIKNAIQNRMAFDNLLGALLGLLLILQVIVMLSIIPAWKIWQSTFILRLIPSVLIIASGMILCYFLGTNPGAPLHQRITLYLILANIFTTALSLLCFKNEWAEDFHGISST